jgi:transcriptional regulator with XRE-family HTH domain
MPHKSRYHPPPLNLGKETLGQRIRRLRKERGLTQAQLAEQMGIAEILISDYERGRLRVSAETAVRLALAFGVSTDELLGVARAKVDWALPNLALVRRMQRIETLPLHQRRALITTIDSFLKASGA